MKKTVVIFLLIAVAHLAAAARGEVWSLDRCVGYAQRRNNDIQLSQIAVRKMSIQKTQSALELLPSLHFSANQYFNWGRSVDMQELVIVRNRLTQQTSGSVGASFSLFDGFARINTLLMNRALVAAAKSDSAETVLEVKADVARAYLGNVLALLTLDRLAESSENVRRQTALARAQAASGLRTAGDVLELEAKEADIQAQMASARGEAAAQMLLLRSLIGCEEEFETDTSAIGLFTPQPAADSGSFARQWRNLSPKVAAARSNLEAASRALKVAKGECLPSVSLQAAYGTYYSDASTAALADQLDGNRNPSVAITLAVPLFDGGRGAAAVAKARADYRAGEIKLQQARDAAESELLQLEQQSQLLEQQLQMHLTRIDLCRERMAVAEAEYRQGQITVSDWIDAREALCQSECEYIQCKCKYQFQLIIIDFYIDGCEE
ncbi:MAG: TolC family protein [Bacteroidales bacterium]|nr:TolC family protein [Bacteroidales bacterium]